MSSSADKTEPLLETSGSVEDPAQTDWQYERLDAGKGRGKCGPQSCCCVASFWVLVSVAVIFAGLAIFLPIFAWNMFAEQIADNNRFDSPNATGYNGFVSQLAQPSLFVKSHGITRRSVPSFRLTAPTMQIGL